MRLFCCFFYCLLLCVNTIIASEYVYPVAYLGNGETVLYIHQHSPTTIELLEWNFKTNQSEQILWSVFNPADLQLLPNGSGFSFIDNGRLRIKLFQKRSPKAIDFDEPMYGINGLHWIDEHTSYCSAQRGNNFGLFELHDDGSVECLIAQDNKDYMYPQKVEDQLFYIERYATKSTPDGLHYHIASKLYQPSSFDSLKTNLVVNFDNTPIIFLTMISATEGFVVEHAPTINSESSTIPFAYHHLIKEGDVWSRNLLFSFSVPTDLLLDSKERLYESILPLLPRIINKKVYFVDCTHNSDSFLDLYFYDLVTKITGKVNVAAKKGHSFVPILCDKALYSGGTKLDGKKEPLISILT